MVNMVERNIEESKATIRRNFVRPYKDINNELDKEFGLFYNYR